jgi:hypothetical protein
MAVLDAERGVLKMRCAVGWISVGALQYASRNMLTPLEFVNGVRAPTNRPFWVEKGTEEKAV